MLRQTVVAMRPGAAAGMDEATCASAYYTSLLTWVGCAVDTAEVAALFGDEMKLYEETHEDDLGGVSLAVFVARHLGGGQSGFHRIGMVGAFLATAGRGAGTGGAWAAQNVGGQHTTFSAPVMAENGGGTDIAVQGNGNALDIYWAPNGSTTWDTGTIAGPGTTYSAPAMFASSNSANVTAVGPGGSLYDYWAPNGSATWNAATVAPPGSVG